MKTCQCTPGLFGWLFGFRCCEHQDMKRHPYGYQPACQSDKPRNPPPKKP